MIKILNRQFFIVFQIWILLSALLLFHYLSYFNDVESLQLDRMLPIFYSLNLFLIFKKLKLDTGKAFFWVIISFSLYHIAPLFFYSFVDILKYLNPEFSGDFYLTTNSNILMRTFLVSVIGLQSALFAYIFTKNNYDSNDISYSYSIYIVYISLLIFIFGLVFRQFISTIFFSYIEVVNFLVLSIFLFTNSNISQKTKKYFLVFILAATLIILMSSTTGRRDVIKFIVLFSLIWSIYIKPFKILSIIVGGMISFFFMVSMVLYRAFFSIETVWKTLKTIPENVDYLYLMIISYLDFMPAHNNYEFIVQNVPNSTPYLWGSSIIKFFTIIIPRQLWPNKPKQVQELIVEHHDNIFVGGSSQSTTLIGEFYWNFGIIGVILGMLLLGLVCKKIDIGNLNSDGFSLKLMIKLLFVSWIIEFFRGGISTAATINSMQTIAPICLIFIFYNLVKKKNSFINYHLSN